jgi:diguanylate cyclase (GGDEF)-like protein
MNIIYIAIIIILALFILLLLVLLSRITKVLVVDPQTELRNFRWFKKKLDNLIKAQTSRSFPMTLAILDIDNFRRFNKVSIKLGDEMLYRFATQLQHEIDAKVANGNVVRYRFGDEFAIVFEHFDFIKSKEIMDSIANKFASNHLNAASSSEEHIVTFGYGLAEFKKGDTFESLTERAEEALIKKKAKDYVI